MASGQPFDADPTLVEAAAGFVAGTVARNPNGSPGLFGPPVDVPADARPLDRLVALTGRDPLSSTMRAGRRVPRSGSPPSARWLQPAPG